MSRHFGSGTQPLLNTIHLYIEQQNGHRKLIKPLIVVIPESSLPEERQRNEQDTAIAVVLGASQHQSNSENSLYWYRQRGDCLATVPC